MTKAKPVEPANECKSKADVALNVVLRILATFAASGLGVIGAGAIAGVSMWKSMFMAGIAGVAVVIEGIARSFLDDGKITRGEIDQVFRKFDKNNN